MMAVSGGEMGCRLAWFCRVLEYLKISSCVRKRERERERGREGEDGSKREKEKMVWKDDRNNDGMFVGEK